MQWVYLLCILVGITGMALIDFRYKLAFWHDRIRTLKTIGVATGLFIIWDLLGIWLGIFRHGDSPYQFAATLLPEFPFEELFFLVLLTYSALVLFTGGMQWFSRTSR